MTAALPRRFVLQAAGILIAGLAAPTAVAETSRSDRLPLVMLDPGHGGPDPGCLGYSGTYEKTVTLETALLLADRLEDAGRCRVLLTRDDDIFVSLTDRVARARAEAADLFLSIHADAIPDQSVRGASVFTLSKHASDQEAALLALRENAADPASGIRLAGLSAAVGDILIDLEQRRTNNLSQRLARDLIHHLDGGVRLMGHSHRAAGFAVLRAPDVPSALVELGCLSNATEERLLGRTSYRQHLAVLLHQSIDAFFDRDTRA